MKKNSNPLYEALIVKRVIEKPSTGFLGKLKDAVVGTKKEVKHGLISHKLGRRLKGSKHDITWNTPFFDIQNPGRTAGDTARAMQKFGKAGDISAATTGQHLKSQWNLLQPEFDRLVNDMALRRDSVLGPKYTQLANEVGKLLKKKNRTPEEIKALNSLYEKLLDMESKYVSHKPVLHSYKFK